MKGTARARLGIAAALIMLIAIVLSFGAAPAQKASALSSEYNGEDNTLYYFSDYYPLMTFEEMEGVEQNGYGYVYDHQYLTETDSEHDFAELVNSNYFNGFGNNCIVVIDIKSFKPDPNDLTTLFTKLSNQNCTTIFVSGTPLSEFSSQSFMSKVDYFVQDDYIRLKNFMGASLQNFFSNNIPAEDSESETATEEPEFVYPEDLWFFFDENLVPLNCYFADALELCARYPFFRIFLESIKPYLFDQDAADYDTITYEEIIDALKGANTKLWVRKNANSYVELIDYNGNEEFEIPMTPDSVAANSSARAALGFNHLSSPFQSFLESVQNFPEGIVLPVYLLEAEPYTFSDSGLSVYTEEEVCGDYDCEADPALLELLEILYSL